MALFSWKDERLFGLDISSTAVKLMELEKTRAGYGLRAYARAPLPRDAIVENTVIDSTAVTQALMDAVEAAGPSTKNVAIAVAGNAVIIKIMDMPTMSELELETQIQYEADQYVPFQIDEVYMDFQILGPKKENPDVMQVALVACKREVIDDYQIILHEAGLTAKCVDCAVFCISNAFEVLQMHAGKPTESKEREEETVALVNIGANLMNIHVLQGGRMAFVRDQFFGGQNLTEEIQRVHGIGFQAAEQLKTDRFEDIQQEALDRFYSGLTSELMRALDFYSANFPDRPVQRMVLSGGSALIPGINAELERRIGVETDIINPMDVIEIDPSRFDAEHLRNIGPMLMVPVGLALRSFD